MVDRMQDRPLIWVLKGLRGGDTAQAMELALQLGGRVEAKQMVFNGLHNIPNTLLGARVSHLTSEAKKLLRPPWPDLVVATGRRTAPVALWIKQQSNAHSKLVQIGRPRMALSAFDLVVTSPQYGMPPDDNVVTVPVPFASPKVVPDFELDAFRVEWSKLPRPWLLAVVGGGKFPLRMNSVDLENFGTALQRRAEVTGGSVILLDSPRSPAGAIKTVSQKLSAANWVYHRGQSSNPYQAALTLCDELVVTSDSVSMVTEMLLSRKPTSVYRLPVSKFKFGWSAQTGTLAALARFGILHPPRDVDFFMRRLLDAGYIGDIALQVPPRSSFVHAAAHQSALERIRSLLNASTSA